MIIGLIIYIDLTFEYLKKDPVILELGSGSCRLAEYLTKKYKKYTATDISLDMLKYSNSKRINKSML